MQCFRFSFLGAHSWSNDCSDPGLKEKSRIYIVGPLTFRFFGLQEMPPRKNAKFLFYSDDNSHSLQSSILTRNMTKIWQISPSDGWGFLNDSKFILCLFFCTFWEKLLKPQVPIFMRITKLSYESWVILEANLQQSAWYLGLLNWGFVEVKFNGQMLGSFW